MNKIELASQIVRERPGITAPELRTEVNCSQSYSYELLRIARGANETRGHIVRKCLTIFSVRPEVVATALLHDLNTAQIAQTLTRKLGIPVSPQYITGLLRRSVTIKKTERNRIIAIAISTE